MIKDIAKKMNLSENDVYDIIHHYFKFMKQQMSHGSVPIIRLPFGSFILKKARLDGYIRFLVKEYKANPQEYTENRKQALHQYWVLKRKYDRYLMQKRKQYNPNGKVIDRSE